MYNGEVTYAITVCNEAEDIKRLLDVLSQEHTHKKNVVIQYDSERATDEVLSIINAEYNFNIRVVGCQLNNDFAGFKNNLLDVCMDTFPNTWVFNIDADEVPSEEFLTDIHDILTDNNNSEDEIAQVYYVPRLNIVHGITQQHIEVWRWKRDNDERINWPDYQMRLVFPTADIRWVGSVHERLVGYETFAFFPDDIDTPYFLHHEKTIQRQEEQNNFYSTLL
jgi:hypothetical protein